MASSDPLETDAEQRLALQQRLECAARLLSKAEDLKRPKRIQGMQRITKQIQSEMSMLKNVNTIIYHHVGKQLVISFSFA